MLGIKAVDRLRECSHPDLGESMQALLSNAFAWMRKASDDKLDGMVALLQKVLQLYAAKTLSLPRGAVTLQPYISCANLMQARFCFTLNASMVWLSEKSAYKQRQADNDSQIVAAFQWPALALHPNFTKMWCITMALQG